MTKKNPEYKDEEIVDYFIKGKTIVTYDYLKEFDPEGFFMDKFPENSNSFTRKYRKFIKWMKRECAYLSCKNKRVGRGLVFCRDCMDEMEIDSDLIVTEKEEAE